MSDDRPGVYVDNGITYYRASELGHCVRRLWAWRSRLERRPFPEGIQKAMDTGTDLEPDILSDLMEYHNFVFAEDGAQKEVIYKVAGDIVIIGHYDQYGHQLNSAFNFEARNRPIDVKAFGQRLVTEYHTKGIMALQHYAWQQSVYALASGHREFIMPIYNKDTETIEPWSLTPVLAPYDELDIYRRIKIVEEAYSKNEMPECTNEYGCPFYYLHDKPKDSHILPESSLPFIRARIAINRKMNALKLALGVLNNRIIEELPELPEGERYNYEGYSIKVLPNPDKFNTDAAKALLTEAGIDWQHEEAYIIHGDGVQLRIDAPKKGKDQHGRQEK